MPRKINAANSAPPPKAPKRKVAQPPLALPRTLSTERDSASGSSPPREEERASREDERSGEARGLFAASSGENTTSQLDEGALAACVEREEEEAHSRDKRVPPDVDKTSQRRRKLSESISNVLAEDDASLSQRHEMESSVELDSKSATRVEAEEARSKNEEESPKQDEIRQDLGMSNGEDFELLNPSPMKPEPPSRDDASDSNSADQHGLSSARNMSSLQVERPRDSLSERDCEVVSRRENVVDSRDVEGENRAHTSPADDSPNESVTKPDRAAEPNGVERAVKPLRHRSVYPERPPRSPRKRLSEENVEAKQPGTARADGATVKSSVLGKDRETCTVISTIPKCERLGAIKEQAALPSLARRDVVSGDQRLEERPLLRNETEDSEDSTARSAKWRTKVVRSQSKSDDFQMDTLKRQKRHLTSPPEDIVYALNLNLPETRNSMPSCALEREQASAGRCANGAREVDIDKGESCGGLVTGACRCTTNVLS